MLWECALIRAFTLTCDCGGKCCEGGGCEEEGCPEGGGGIPGLS